MDKRLITAYKSITNNQQNINSTPRSLKEAYGLVKEKTAFYSKEYPNDTETSPDIEGMENLGFVSDEYEKRAKISIRSQNIKNDIKNLFIDANWIRKEKEKENITIKDFEYSFLVHLSELFIEHDVNLKDILDQRIESKAINKIQSNIDSGHLFNLFDVLIEVYPSLQAKKELLHTLMHKIGKTGDVTFGSGEILLTLLGGYKKPMGKGDLEDPKNSSVKIEVKTNGGRLCKSEDFDSNFKNHVKSILTNSNSVDIIKNTDEKNLESVKQDFLRIQAAIKDNKENLKVFKSNIEETFLKISDYSSENIKTAYTELQKLKKEIGLSKLATSFNTIWELNDKESPLQKNQNISEADKNSFKQSFNTIKKEIFEIDSYKNFSKLLQYKTNVFDDNTNMFFKKMISDTYDLNRGVIAQILASSIDVKDPSDNEAKKIQQTLIELLSEHTDKESLEGAIFAVQAYAYSKNNEFSHLLIINSENGTSLGIKCTTETNTIESLISGFFNIFKKYLALDIVTDNRGGARVSLKKDMKI
jgi:hypothetical protein